MDIFLSNELSAVFEHLDLIVHHNKDILVAPLGSCYRGTQYLGICELFICSRAFFSFLGKFTFVFVNLSSDTTALSRINTSFFPSQALMRGSCRWDVPAFWMNACVSFIWETSFWGSTSWKMSAGMTKHLINWRGGASKVAESHLYAVLCESTLKSLACFMCICRIWKHVFIRHILTFASKKEVL